MYKKLTLSPEQSQELRAYTCNISHEIVNISTVDKINYISSIKADFQEKFSAINLAYTELVTYQSAALLLENLPSFSNDIEVIHHKETLSLLLSSLIGMPFQYKQQNNGKIVAEITPSKDINLINSGGSREKFDWHTDDRIFNHPFRTQWIQLLGVYNSSLAETYIALVDDIIKELSIDEINILMERRFEVRMPFSFQFSKTIWSEPLSILWLNQFEQYEIGIPTYNVRTIDPHDHHAQDVLNHLTHAMNNKKRVFVLKEDNLLIFNNDRAIHSRGNIDGERLILRTYIREDIDDLRFITETDGYTFDVRFLL